MLEEESGREDYEIIPVTPIKKLEQRVERVESAGTMPQLQSLINQIIELIRDNQKIVNEVIQANTELKNEISKLPSKMDELINSIRSFLSLVEAAGREEAATPTTTAIPSTDMFKPLVDQLQKITEQNQRLIESNQSVLDQMDKMSKRLKGGTPVSSLLSNYPSIRSKREDTQ
jgi:regulator of replication initiation timing